MEDVPDHQVSSPSFSSQGQLLSIHLVPIQIQSRRILACFDALAGIRSLDLAVQSAVQSSYESLTYIDPEAYV